MEQLGKLASANPDARQFVLGERAFSFNELTQISRAANVAAEAHVSSLPQGEFEIGTPAHKNFLRAAYGEFYANTAANSVDVVNNFAPELGEKLTPLTRLPGSAVAEAKQGGLWGGVSSGVMTAIHVTRDGFDIADLAPIAKNSAIGGAAGAVTALGERALQPVVEKAVGQSIGFASNRTSHC